MGTRMLGVTKEPKKSALKKSSSCSVDVEQKTSLAVKGLGKRQKSFVQFDDNDIVIDDVAQEPADDNTEGGTEDSSCTGKGARWTDSMKINKKKFGNKEKSSDEKNN